MRILLFILLLIPSFSQAAPVELESSQDGRFVRVLLTATTTPINGIEGVLKIPEGAVVSNVRIGESIIQNWLEAPYAGEQEIRFAGIIPGGFVGAATAGAGLSGPATLFTFSYSGSLSFELTDLTIYLHDGLGSKTVLQDAPAEIQTETRLIAPSEDRIPPEYVEATPLEDERIAEGRRVLVLSAFDAGSGIDYFEVQEGNGEWERAETVYVVKDVYGLQNIRLRAYDRAGNFVEVMVSGKNQPLLILVYALSALVLLLGIGVYLRKSRLRKNT
jgi:hypothetical protein